jgi:hypothetical protein
MIEATDFLRALRPVGPWHLVSINPDRVGPMRGCRAVTAEQVEQFIAANQRRNIYYHLNRCYRGKWMIKAAKQDISDIEFIHGDLDPAPGESPSDAKKRYCAALASSGLPTPNFLVDTGGGLQMLWHIESIAVEDPAAPVVARVEGISKAVMRLLGCHDTSTHNCDRILRLPGTTNWPDAKKTAAGRVPVMARLITATDGVHSLDCFPQPSPDARATTGPQDAGDAAEVDPLKHDWQTVVAKYAPRLKTVHRRIMTAVSLESPNRSRMIFMIAAELYDAGAEWDEIAAVVWRSPYFIDKHDQSIDRLESELRRIKKRLEIKDRKYNRST